jgi:HAD superfamily hydrolase (TIGR01509 family)
MPQIELVIFDNDGVVVDSEVLANGVLARVLTGYGHPTTTEESIREYLGGTLGGVRSIVEERSSQPLPPEFEDLYHQRLFAAFEELQPVNGIETVLQTMRWPYCLASSGTYERIERSLRITHLLGYFEGKIFSADDVEHGKPAPDLFLHASSAMGAPPAGCVVIEDSYNGVVAARAAGMRVIGYGALTPADRLAGADQIVSDMREIPALLDEMSR